MLRLRVISAVILAPTVVLCLLLTLLYAVLYLILRSADYALLAGSILAFAAVAGTMYATRNENWYGERREKSGGGWFRRPTPPAAAARPADITVMPRSSSASWEHARRSASN